MKLPDSPQCVGAAAEAPAVGVEISAGRASVCTMVVKLLGAGANSSNEGSSDSGVCWTDLVVGGIVCRSKGSGPVTVGYVPVQYVTVVTIVGVGKTKTTDVSPYDTILVIKARACRADVLLVDG